VPPVTRTLVNANMKRNACRWNDRLISVQGKRNRMKKCEKLENLEENFTILSVRRGRQFFFIGFVYEEQIVTAEFFCNTADLYIFSLTAVTTCSRKQGKRHF